MSFRWPIAQAVCPGQYCSSKFCAVRIILSIAELIAMVREKGGRVQLQEDLAAVRRLWSSGNRSAAVAGAEGLYKRFPTKAVVARLLAYYLYTTRNLDRALAIAKGCFDRSPDAHVLALLCRILTRAGRNVEILELTETCYSNPKLLPYALLCHGGALLKVYDKFDPAVEFFHKAAEAGNIENDQSPARAAMQIAKFHALTHTQFRSNRVHFLTKSPPQQIDAVLMAAADERYFRALYRTYLDTFLAHNGHPGHLVHFHLYDPSKSLVEEAEMLTAAMHGRLQFSMETTDLTNRSYYYVGRFVQMPVLMARYSAPIVVTDIDCAFRGGVQQLLTSVHTADLGLLEIERHIVPWRNLLAGLVVFNPTENSRSFATAIRNFLLQLPADTNYWFVDQLSLLQCDYMAREALPSKIVRVTEDWRQLMKQGTGKTGMPEAKAARVANSLSRARPAPSRSVETKVD